LEKQIKIDTFNTAFKSIEAVKTDNVLWKIIPHVNDTLTEKRLSAADIAIFLEQFVGVTPGMKV